MLIRDISMYISNKKSKLNGPYMFKKHESQNENYVHDSFSRLHFRKILEYVDYGSIRNINIEFCR